MSIEELYAQPILQLAREARDRVPVPRPTARATVLSNRFCGDEVRLEVHVEEGLIREIACSVHACVLNREHTDYPWVVRRLLTLPRHGWDG